MTVRSKSENGILINYMAAERWKMQMHKEYIGGNSRMARGKDMQHKSGGVVPDIMETDTSGST